MIKDIGNYAFQAGYVFSYYDLHFQLYQFRLNAYGFIDSVMYLYLDQVERFLVHE